MAWLEASFAASFKLLHSDRLQAINDQQLQDPHRQHPSLLFCIGGTQRDIALRTFFPYNSLEHPTSRSGLLNLEADNASLTSRNPIFFADSPTFPRLTAAPTEHRHPQDFLTLGWKRFPPDDEVVDLIYCRLIFLFVDVICVFADDFPDLATAIDRTNFWMCLGDCSTLPSHIRPAIIIVQSGPGGYEDVSEETLRDHPAVFRTFELMQVGAKDSPPQRNYDGLKELIWRRMSELRMDRVKSKTLFSASHIASFFRQRLRQLARSPSPRFDFVHASRHGNPIRREFEIFMGAFFSLANGHGFREGDMASVAASAILMNAFPPLMHRFDASTVFKRLYRSKCVRALQRAILPNNVERVCALIERHLASFFPIIEAGRSSADLHQNNLKKFYQLFQPIEAKDVCLSCLNRAPRHALKCGHSICDNCVRVFGRRLPGLEEAYEVVTCVTCQTPSGLHIFLKPPTAGVRVISVSSLGNAAVVGLIEVIRALHKTFGSSCDVLSFIDFAFGVGSGGVIANALFNTSEVSDLVGFLGRDPSIHATKGLGRLGRVLSAASKGSIRNLLKQAQRDLLPHSRVSRTHVAFLVKSLTSIYRNYARRSTVRKSSPPTAKRDLGSGVQGLPYETPVADVSTGRAALEFALWECFSVWPGAATDVVISLEPGDGYQRLQRASVSALAKHGEQEVAAAERAGVLPNCFRLLFSAETANIRPNAIQQVVREKLGDKNDVLDISRALLASNFFFELHAAPSIVEHGTLTCFGCVRSRISARELKSAFAQLVREPWVLSIGSAVFGELDPAAHTCMDCGRYGKRVQFNVRHIREVMTMFALDGPTMKRRLSGFPQCMEWFAREQKLQQDFGREDHGVGSGWLCPSCDAPKNMNIRRTFSTK